VIFGITEWFWLAPRHGLPSSAAGHATPAWHHLKIIMMSDPRPRAAACRRAYNNYDRVLSSPFFSGSPCRGRQGCVGQQYVMYVM
jgi:hypothetical protein